MATEKTTTSPKPAAVGDAEAKRQGAVTIARIASDSFAEIRAIARLTLRSLETPDGHRDIESVVYALRAIWGKADDAENTIDAEAEGMGCQSSSVDPILERIWRAKCEAGRQIEACAAAARQEVSHG